MTFIYIIKKIIGNWITVLSSTHMMQNLVVQETQSISLARTTKEIVTRRACN